MQNVALWKKEIRKFEKCANILAWTQSKNHEQWTWEKKLYVIQKISQKISQGDNTIESSKKYILKQLWDGIVTIPIDRIEASYYSSLLWCSHHCCVILPEYFASPTVTAMHEGWSKKLIHNFMSLRDRDISILCQLSLSRTVTSALSKDKFIAFLSKWNSKTPVQTHQNFSTRVSICHSASKILPFGDSSIVGILEPTLTYFIKNPSNVGNFRDVSSLLWILSLRFSSPPLYYILPLLSRVQILLQDNVSGETRKDVQEKNNIKNPRTGDEIMLDGVSVRLRTWGEKEIDGISLALLNLSIANLARSNSILLSDNLTYKEFHHELYVTARILCEQLRRRDCDWREHSKVENLAVFFDVIKFMLDFENRNSSNLMPSNDGYSSQEAGEKLIQIFKKFYLERRKQLSPVLSFVSLIKFSNFLISLKNCEQYDHRDFLSMHFSRVSQTLSEDYRRNETCNSLREPVFLLRQLQNASLIPLSLTTTALRHAASFFDLAETSPTLVREEGASYVSNISMRPDENISNLCTFLTLLPSQYPSSFSTEFASPYRGVTFPLEKVKKLGEAVREILTKLGDYVHLLYDQKLTSRETVIWVAWSQSHHGILDARFFGQIFLQWNWQSDILKLPSQSRRQLYDAIVLFAGKSVWEGGCDETIIKEEEEDGIDPVCYQLRLTSPLRLEGHELICRRAMQEYLYFADLQQEIERRDTQDKGSKMENGQFKKIQGRHGRENVAYYQNLMTPINYEVDVLVFDEKTHQKHIYQINGSSHFFLFFDDEIYNTKQRKIPIVDYMSIIKNPTKEKRLQCKDFFFHIHQKDMQRYSILRKASKNVHITNINYFQPLSSEKLPRENVIAVIAGDHDLTYSP